MHQMLRLPQEDLCSRLFHHQPRTTPTPRYSCMWKSVVYQYTATFMCIQWMQQHCESVSASTYMWRFKALVNEDALLPMMFLGRRKLGNICWGHEQMFLNKIRNIFCVRDKCCPRGQTGKHLCRQQYVLVCQGLKTLKISSDYKVSL